MSFFPFAKSWFDSTKILHTFLRVSYPFPTAAHFLQLPALHHQKAWVPKMGRDWLWIQLGLRKHRQWWEKISSSDLSFQGSGSRLLLSALIIAAKFWFFQSPVVVFQANESWSWKSLLCLENWRRLPQDGSSPTWPLLPAARARDMSDDGDICSHFSSGSWHCIHSICWYADCGGWGEGEWRHWLTTLQQVACFPATLHDIQTSWQKGWWFTEPEAAPLSSVASSF